MLANLHRSIVFDDVKDMKEGVIYKKGVNSYMLHYCDMCKIPMKVALVFGELRWTVCRKCSDKLKVRYPPLPDKIEDMIEGKIYKNKWHGACTLHYCDICKEPCIVAIRKGRLEYTMCHKCANGTLEKRVKQSKLQKGVPMKEEHRTHLSEFMKEKCENNSDWVQHLTDIANKPCLQSTRDKISKANKNQVHSPEQDMAQSVRLKAKWSDPTFKNEMLDKLFSSPKITPTKPELILDGILQDHFPVQWAYNGDNSCKFRIDGKIPDFVNLDGKPMLIEMFSVHHCPLFNKNIRPNAIGKIRLELFKKFGYDCLIIWEPELKDVDHVVEKVKTFMGAS